MAVALGARSCCAACPAAAGAAPHHGRAGEHVRRHPRRAAGGPQSAYRCCFNVNTDAFTGADGTASAIGWLGDYNSVVTCLGGTFVVQDGPGALFQNDGFGVYDGQRTTWADADGYLPAQVTTFDDTGTTVAITEFADEVTLGGHPFVAVYSRVRVTNPTGARGGREPRGITQPGPPRRRVGHRARPRQREPRLRRARGPLRRRRPVAERPGAGRLRAASTRTSPTCARSGTRSSTPSQRISVPDPALVDAYKSGFITTQIARSGNDLDTGVNGYESEFSHDVVGILTNLFTQGYFTDAHALLTEARNVVGAQGQYVDGLWTYAVPWAVYLMKTGDTSFVAQNFATAGPAGAAQQPSIEDAAHAIAADRTGPQGTMEATDDIDTQGYWTVDDYEALLGLAAYRYVAATIGNATEASWATSQYDSLLAATNAVLGQTISQNKLDYLPCSLIQPNTANRCDNPRDANWTSPFGFGSLGVGGLTARGHGHRAGPDADRRHLRLRVRPPAGPPSRRHDGRLPRRLLLERLRRGHRLGRAGGLHPPGPGHRRLRVHAGQRAERAAVVVGELDGARSQLALGRPPPRRGAGVVAPCVGHGGRQQGAARLPRRATEPAARWSSGAACPQPGCTPARHRSR